MGERSDDHQFGLDFQRGQGIITTVSIARKDPPFHRPGVPFHRRDWTALRAQARSRLTRATFSSEVSTWLQGLDQGQWENLLAGMRLMPWVVYAALWWVSDGLARRAAEDEGGDDQGLVHGVSGTGLVATGKAMSGLAHWLSPNR